MATPITRYAIAIPDADVAELSARLKQTRWPHEYANQDWSYGTRLDYLKALLEYWHTDFDWRSQEARLNRWPQFLIELEGLKVHFIHVRGSSPHATPLLLLHGWPGSIVEMTKLMPLLSDPRAREGHAFDLIVPSLPGFGFSGRPAAPGMSVRKVADLMSQLMSALGYRTFGVQGGDLGAGIAMWLARQHAGRVRGIHLNYIPASFRPWIEDEPSALSAAEREWLSRVTQFVESEGGYSHMHRTKPQTLGYALNDSPAGLAAWIIEKFRSWSDCAGDLESVFTRDEILTNISVYWFTSTITSAIRMYRENVAAPLQFGSAERVSVPLAFAHFPKELVVPPREWVGRVFEIRRWTTMPRGGHFAALEVPDLLADSIQDFFSDLT